MLPPSNPPKHRRGLVSLATTAIFLGFSLFIWLNQQYVLDTVHFWSYQPPAAVASIASRAGLSDAGTFALYAAQPSIEGSQTFNDKCDRIEQNTAILGCYVNDRIYLYDVTDQRLDGIEDVTAAHEMLHAVYQRLSSTEKSRIDSLVDVEYKKLSDIPEFAERMAFYARTEPGERNNELHSIIGTEVRDISPALESHYAKYFSSRGKVLALHEKYRGAFTTLTNKAKELEVQLDKLGEQIEANTNKYNRDVKQLNADIEDFNERATSNKFSSQAAFNSERQALQRRADAVTATRQLINSEIDEYENLRLQYNNTAAQTQDLYKSIDSNLAPAPKV